MLFYFSLGFYGCERSFHYFSCGELIYELICIKYQNFGFIWDSFWFFFLPNLSIFISILFLKVYEVKMSKTR